MLPISNTRTASLAGLPARLLLCHAADSPSAGCRSQFHRARAQVRSAEGADRRSPHHEAADRRSSILEPCNLAAKPPSNKNTLPVEGQWSRKKLTPLQRVCPKCQAIWDFETETLPFLIIFNSDQIGTPSMHRYTSGIPSPALFSIRWKWVFFGKCCLNEFHRLCSVRGIFNPFHVRFGECIGVLLPDRGESSDDVFTRKIVKLMHMCGLSPVDGQTTKTRSYLFGIDRGTELSSLFSGNRQFFKPFELIDQGHAVSAFSGLPHIFDQFGHFREGFTVKQFSGVLRGATFSVASFSGTLCVGVFTLDIILGKFTLSVGESSRSTSLAYSVFCGFILFIFQNPSPCDLQSVTVIQKWYSYNRCSVRVVSLVPFVSLFSEKNKLNRLPVENTICPVTFMFDLMGYYARILLNQVLIVKHQGPRFKVEGVLTMKHKPITIGLAKPKLRHRVLHITINNRAWLKQAVSKPMTVKGAK